VNYFEDQGGSSVDPELPAGGTLQNGLIAGEHKRFCESIKTSAGYIAN